MQSRVGTHLRSRTPARGVRAAAFVAALVAATTTTACGEDPTGTSPTAMAARFEALASAHARDASGLAFLWRVAAAGLRSGAPITDLTVEIDGTPREFKAVVVQSGTTTGSTDSRGPLYLVGWGDRKGQEMLDLWSLLDSVSLDTQSGTAPSGGAVLQVFGADSLLLHGSGWTKLASTPAAGSCHSSLRASDVCRTVTVDVAASLVMRTVAVANIGGAPSATPPTTAHTLVVRPTRMGGVYILQHCELGACSVSFP